MSDQKPSQGDANDELAASANEHEHGDVERAAAELAGADAEDKVVADSSSDSASDSESEAGAAETVVEEVAEEATEGDLAQDSAVDNSPAETTAPAPAAAAKGGGKGLAVFALLLALLALAAAGLVGWQFYQQQQSLSVDTQSRAEQSRELTNTVDQQVSALGGLQRQFDDWRGDSERQLSSQSERIEALVGRVDEASQVADSHGRRLLALTATTTDDWRVAEVEYLLRLASQRLMISGDVGTTLGLMAAADQILLELADPRLLPVRRAIAEDSSALKLLAELDIDGMFLQLAAITGRVDELPVINIPAFEPGPAPAADAATADDLSGSAATNASAEAEAEQPTAVWLQRLASVFERGWLEVRSWVAINRPEANIKPLMPPEQQVYLRSNLKLLLNQAQIALLEKRPEPYQSSLNTAVQWLADYFPDGEAAIDNTVADLESLAAIDISPELPDISASLLAIKAYLDRRARLEGGPAKAAATAESDA